MDISLLISNRSHWKKKKITGSDYRRDSLNTSTDASKKYIAAHHADLDWEVAGIEMSK